MKSQKFEIQGIHFQGKRYTGNINQTMECPHLRESVKVKRDFIKNKKCELSISSSNKNSIDSSLNSGGGGSIWRCGGKLRIMVDL